MDEIYVAQTETTLPPPVDKQPGRKITKWALAVLVPVLLLTIGSGIYFLNQNSALKPIKSNPLISNNRSSQSSPTPKNSPKTDTSNWKILNTAGDKSSIKYPPELTLQASGSSEISVKCPNSGCPGSYNIFSFTVTRSGITSIQDYLSSLNTSNPNNYPYIVDYQIITVNGLVAVETLTPAPSGSSTGPTVSVFIVIDGTGYIYSYTYLDPNLNSVTSLNQLPNPNPNILSTVQIGNQPSTNVNTISSWNVYTNAAQGITLQYPSGWYVNGGGNINTCVTFSDSQYADPAHSRTVISLCTYPTPLPSGSNNQITVNGYQGVKVQQTSTWGASEGVFLANPKGGSTEIEILAGDANIFNLMLSTFKFIQ